VAIVTNVTADFWKICEAGAKKGAAEFGVDLIFRQPSKGDVSVQKEVIDAVTKQGIKGIAISVFKPEEQSNDLKLIAEKMPLITMDNDAVDSGRLCYVGTDNYEAGKAAGQLVKEALPEGGTVVIYVGSKDPANARQRAQGVMDTLAGTKDAKGPKLGKYELYSNDIITDDSQPANCFNKAKDIMTKLLGNDKICMVGLWAYNAPAILQAAKEKGLTDKIKIVGFDEDPDTLTGIQDGKIYGTIVQDPFTFGYKSVEILAALAKGDKSKLMKDPVPVKVVTKEGGPGKVKVDEFWANLKKILGQ
jgi:ribose transport system substrate-binding protein